MICIVDGEVFNAAALVGRTDETLSRMVSDPVLEALALLVQFARVEMKALELAVEAELCFEVCGRNTRPLIREVVLEVPEHFGALLTGIDIESRLVEIDLCPLVDALAHLLAQRAQHDVVHGRHDGTLSWARPAVLHRCQVEEHAFHHEIVE